MKYWHCPLCVPHLYSYLNTNIRIPSRLQRNVGQSEARIFPFLFPRLSQLRGTIIMHVSEQAEIRYDPWHVTAIIKISDAYFNDQHQINVVSSWQTTQQISMARRDLCRFTFTTAIHKETELLKKCPNAMT